VRNLDATIPLPEANTLADNVDNDFSNERIIANLSGFSAQCLWRWPLSAST
jgi:hypothetical protein